MDDVLIQFGIDTNVCITQVTQGLINATWKIESKNEAYIMQRVNTMVFKKPEDVAHNISSIANYLALHYPGYKFTSPLKTIEGKTLYKDKEGKYHRIFPFINGSHTRSTVETAQQAYEAAKQFGKFTAALKNFNAKELKTTIPSFHDLSLRYQQFLHALSNADIIRLEGSMELINQLKKHSAIVDHFEEIKNKKLFKLRVTHHDTKISNVLLDNDDKGICVIDLDTVMPGYFISDVGDMMRTYLSPVTEEEQDLDKIIVRPEIYDAIVTGYLHAMKDELNEVEKQHFFYAGKFMIYMQALRFLTDHLNNDIYYGAAYPGHNYARAANQLALLQQFMGLTDVIENPLSTR
ncbi:MAG: aminoglycoside phosphotransferase family protein [Sphingobacteriales bacterium]|nr:MAG: aminoglycoside phosphotransferase family protein [Sphingobacteriales bacterium]